ncbi:hypothetical protein DEMA109039_15405 [Deinococcus marmoris]
MWKNDRMKTMLPALALAVALTACDPQEAPDNGRVETDAIGVVDVNFPATASASEPMIIAIRYSKTCNQSSEQIALTARTETELRLNGTARHAKLPPNLACTPIYIEKTIEYIDPGTPARTNPFEIIVNGRSWGTVEVK